MRPRALAAAESRNGFEAPCNEAAPSFDARNDLAWMRKVAALRL
jgi:hypothetical protein